MKSQESEVKSQKSRVRSLKSRLFNFQFPISNFLLVILLIPTFSFSDYSKGVCGASFLKIDALPRPSAMGGAFSSVSDDLGALYYNPAGLGQLQLPSGVTGGAEWIEKTRFGLIGYCSPISENSGLGVSVLYLKTDKMPFYSDDKSTTPQEGDFDANDLAIRFGYGIRFSKSNYFGIVGGWLNQRIESKKSSSFFFDIGQIYKPSDRVALSFVLQNIGSKVKFINEEDELPLTLRIGLSYNPVDSAIIACDFVKPKDNEWQIKGGIEWQINNILTLRGGYNSQIFQDLGIGVNMGFGIHISTFKLDYAYVPYNDLGETHRFSFTTNFGK